MYILGPEDLINVPEGIPDDIMYPETVVEPVVEADHDEGLLGHLPPEEELPTMDDDDCEY